MGRLNRTIIGIFFIIFWSLPSAFAQPVSGNYGIYESVNDSLDLANHFYDIYDSNASYHPASELYESWDNEYIHYPGVDFSKKEDTTSMLLIGAAMGSFVIPKKGAINSDYGWRHRRFHYGIDVDLDIGDSVVSAFDGVVRISRYHKGYGNVVVVRHYNGLETIYGHLSVARVVENQNVKAGELLGYGGSTGRSTGPHLHFETRYLGTPFNPRKIIDFEKRCLQSDTLLICKYTFNNIQPAKSVVAATQNTHNTGGQASYSSGKAVYHSIRSGETLSALAVKYHTTVSRICQLNGFTAKKVLQIGQKVRVK